jgi:multidrug/hemolysin transport system permease protein
MNIILQLTKRNMALYLRNKSAVFFSFFSMLIIIGLYVLFLGDMITQQLTHQYNAEEGVKWLVNAWIMGGIIAVNAVTITLATLSTMVEDKERLYIKDFIVAPIKRSQIVMGYILSSIILGVFMTCISFVAAQLYIIAIGGELLSFVDMVKVLVGITFSVLAIASIAFFGFTFITSEKTVSIVSAIVGTLIGFLAGVYVPIGVMPEYIQKVVKFIPITYSATLFKSIFTKAPANIVFGSSTSEALHEYNLMMGNVMVVNNNQVTYSMMLGILLLTAIIFFVLSVIRIRRMKN